jgi:hypothetical protein
MGGYDPGRQEEDIPERLASLDCARLHARKQRATRFAHARLIPWRRVAPLG